MPIADYLTSASLVRAARSAHPAFKYAIAAAGVVGIVVVLTNYGTSYATLVFGTILLFVLMVMFLVFSQAAAVTKAHLALPARVLVWAFLVLGVLTAVLLFTSAFIDKPLPFRSYIIRQLEPSTHAVTVEKAVALTPAASVPLLHNPKSTSAPSQQLRAPQSAQTAKVSPITPKSRPQESRAAAPSQQLSAPQSAPQSAKTTEVSPITPNSSPQESSASTPSQQPSAPQSVRTSVKTIARAVQGQTMSNRQTAIAAALPSLPDDLSGPEIAILLADETMSTRFAILQLLTKRTKQKSLDPRNVAAILAAENMSTRESMTAILAPLIKSPIAASLLGEILGPATDCTRTRCLRHLVPLVERPIPERDVEAILRSISGSCRSEAVGFLLSGGP